MSGTPLPSSPPPSSEKLPSKRRRLERTESDHDSSASSLVAASKKDATATSASDQLQFLGCCTAIAPRVLLTAGHHYNMTSDDVGWFFVVTADRNYDEDAATTTTRRSSSSRHSTSESQQTPLVGSPPASPSDPSKGGAGRRRAGHTVKVQYFQKAPTLDAMLVWVDEDLPSFVSNFRGVLPGVGAQVLTAWLCPESPLTTPLIVSPGQVIHSHPQLSYAQGTVSVAGCSGAPVLSEQGDRVVGMHLSSNVKNGSRTSEFVCSKTLVSLLAEAGVNLRSLLN